MITSYRTGTHCRPLRGREHTDRVLHLLQRGRAFFRLRRSEPDRGLTGAESFTKFAMERQTTEWVEDGDTEQWRGGVN